MTSFCRGTGGFTCLQTRNTITEDIGKNPASSRIRDILSTGFDLGINLLSVENKDIRGIVWHDSAKEIVSVTQGDCIVYKFPVPQRVPYIRKNLH